MRETQRRNRQKVERLRELASSVQRLNLQEVYGDNLMHVGISPPTIDIPVTLNFAVLRIDPSQADDPERDRFILSKGRSVVALSSRRKALCESWQKAVARAILDSTKPASTGASFL